jgi:hypothetical protein
MINRFGFWMALDIFCHRSEMQKGGLTQDVGCLNCCTYRMAFSECGIRAVLARDRPVRALGVFIHFCLSWWNAWGNLALFNYPQSVETPKEDLKMPNEQNDRDQKQQAQQQKDQDQRNQQQGQKPQDQKQQGQKQQGEKQQDPNPERRWFWSMRMRKKSRNLGPFLVIWRAVLSLDQSDLLWHRRSRAIF